MKPLTIVMVFVVILGAIALGWIYEASSKKISVRPDLEIPTDIDFFLSQMNYRVFNKFGNLDYELQSPYLEHFIKDDISRIKQPMIQVYRENGDWRVEAMHGNIFHQQDWLQLKDNVVMQKTGANSIRVRSESMLFKPDQDLMSSRDRVIIESDSAKISGDEAVFDLRNGVYSLNNSKAIYYHEDN